MERLIHKLFYFTLISIACLINSVYADTHSPVGYWKIMDNATGKPKSIIKIWETPQKTLTASIVKLFPNVLLENTPSQPALGSVILSGLTKQHGQWTGGKMYDLMNGKTYNCAMSLTKRGDKLNVHSFTNLPLFGATQIWERVDLLSDADVESNLRREA